MAILNKVGLIFLIVICGVAASKKYPPPCKKCPKPNQVFSTDGKHPCRDTCESPDFSQVCFYSPGNYSGCICKDGYLENRAGKCIKEDLCIDCADRPNEEYSECDNHPCQNTCAYPNLIAVCTYAAGCYPGCICKENYLRNDNGECVYKDDCPPSARPSCPNGEEYQECGTSCPITCENKDSPPTACTANCVQGCFCSKGLVRNTQTGECVPPEKCPEPKCDDPNAFYNGCGNACALTCKNKDDPPFCPLVCLPDSGRCECNPGYAYNDEGVCIKVEDCPKLCTDPNEIFYTRCKPCRYTCENPSFSCAAVCTPGCECKDGYIRKNNFDSTCVPKESCPQCPKNEEYTTCGTACPITCKNKDNPPQACTKNCVEGCFCKKGYVRDEESGKCVLPNNCPLDPVCEDPNAEYLSCKRCVGSCDNRNPICDRSCRPAGCYCKKGYVKRSQFDSTCVKESACPKCPLNEKYDSCGTACPITCKNKDNPPTGCSKNCVDGCFCESGYVRDEASGKCVKPEKCPPKPKPPTCKKNEVWLKKCAKFQDTCQKSYDPTLGTKPGCCCKEGYVREFTGGNCIPRCECDYEDDEHWD